MVIISKAMIKKLDELKAKENMDKNLDALNKDLKKFMSHLVSESDKPNKNKRIILSDGISFGDSIKSKMN